MLNSRSIMSVQGFAVAVRYEGEGLWDRDSVGGGVIFHSCCSLVVN